MTLIENILSEDIENIIEKTGLCSKIFYINFFKSEVHKIFKKLILKDVEAKVGLIITKLNQEDISNNVVAELEMHLKYFIIFGKCIYTLRKHRCIHKMGNITEESLKKELKSHLESIGINSNSVKDAKLDYDLIAFKESSTFKVLQQRITKFNYFERDIIILCIQDIFKKHNVKNYHNHFSFILKKLEEEFPDIFYRKMKRDSGYDNNFKINLNKIRAKLTDKSLILLKHSMP